MKKLEIDKIENILNIGILNDIDDIVFEKICIDSRKIMKNDIFWAIKGENFNGNDFIYEAVSKGAAAVITNRKDVDLDIPVIVVEDTLISMQRYSKRLIESYPDMKIIALTGSSGKTSCKELLYKVLSEKYTAARTYKNYNNNIGIPLSIVNFDLDLDYLILEMGMNHRGELKFLSNLYNPDIAIITNIQSAHIGFFESREDLIKTKLEIISGLKSDGKLYYLKQDYDNFIYRDDIDKIGISINDNNYHLNSSFIEIEHGKFVFKYPGKHWVDNLSVIIQVARDQNINDNQIQMGLDKYISPENRFNIIKIGHITIIDDCYNANPESTIAAIDTMNLIQYKGKKIAVLGDMAELGWYSHDGHKRVGQILNENNIDRLYYKGKYKKDVEAGYGRVAEDIQRVSVLADELISNKDIETIVLFKGSRAMKIDEDLAEFKKKLINKF